MLLQASNLGELGAIIVPFTLNLFCSKVVFVLPMRHQFEINRGQAKKTDPRKLPLRKKKGKKTTCMSLFNHWRKEYKRNNAVVVKPQEQRKRDFTPFYLWVMLLFGQGPDSLKEHIYPSFRAQSNRWQCEKQCAHQIQKNTSTHKLRKQLNHKEWAFSLTLCKAQGIFKMSVINYCP